MNTPDLPASLRAVLPAARWEQIDTGHSGAQVWRSTRHIVKIQRHQGAVGVSLQQERERLRWLAGRLPAPQVVAYDTTATHEYLAMTRLPGIDLSHPDALLHPERLVNLLARALRELHALPLRDCPFNMSLNVALHLARERVQAGLIDESDFDEARQGRTATSVFNELVKTRPVWEDLVVTHGDPCLPNFIVNGELLEGLIDVGRLGIADRHADLGLAYRSTRHNLSVEYAEQLLDHYGREKVDMDKIRYYMLLDELW
ncbi:APH(3') family aminoglycoside O-phosphotransferase [Deinococcus fonticola]|uniref:APH(3') family aminoglycoside O-phosphotransferase n=1 Tax=Deinococcus fonticola TaxID=2528713 RepID=UPI001074A65F|nr:APH(3') family aminoglycoside O-phosphotransferase [Deinococcus fonticola]